MPVGQSDSGTTSTILLLLLLLLRSGFLQLYQMDSCLVFWLMQSTFCRHSGRVVTSLQQSVNDTWQLAVEPQPLQLPTEMVLNRRLAGFNNTLENKRFVPFVNLKTKRLNNNVFYVTLKKTAALL